MKDNKHTHTRVESRQVKRGGQNHKAIGYLCQHARRLYNRSNYLARQAFFAGEKVSDQAIDKILKKGELAENDKALYQVLGSAASQRTVQIMGQNWKSYFAALKAFSKTPSKFKAKPKPPRYAKSAKTLYLSRNAFCVKDGKMEFASKLGLVPLDVSRLVHIQPFNAPVKDTVIKEVRFVPTGNTYRIELIYIKPISTQQNRNLTVLLDRNKNLFIDLGIDNLATLVSDQPDIAPVLISGRAMKSINAKYNKDVAVLRAKGAYPHIRNKGVKRRNALKDYLHKTSHWIIHHCLKHDLGTIVLGHNPDWKQSINIGKVNNQKFVSIPHATLIHQIQYKASEFGINVIVREESYTSKASALDCDVVPNYGDKVKGTFSGKRIKRGLYRTGSGRLLNADVNGALNIGRKELGDAFISKLVNSGCVFQPKRLCFLKGKANGFRRTDTKPSCLKTAA